MAIKYVLFDTDGVIVNSLEMFSQKLMRENSIKEEDILPFFKEIFVPKCMVGTADLKKEIAPWLFKWKWKGTVDELLQYWFRSEHNIDSKIVRYVESLRNKGIHCYLVTNQEKYRTEYLRNEMGFGKLFDAVFSSAQLGCKKPSLEFYKKVFTAINENAKVSKDEVLYIDDEEKNVAAGKQFGFTSVLYTSFDKLASLGL